MSWDAPSNASFNDKGSKEILKRVRQLTKQPETRNLGSNKQYNNKARESRIVNIYKQYKDFDFAKG